MKFEKPIMNISMFEMENVVTNASNPTDLSNANNYADELVNGESTSGTAAKATKLTITF